MAVSALTVPRLRWCPHALLTVLFPVRSFARLTGRTSLLTRCCADLRINWIKHAHFSNYLSFGLLHVPVPSGSDPCGLSISYLCVLTLRLNWIYSIPCSCLLSRIKSRGLVLPAPLEPWPGPQKISFAQMFPQSQRCVQCNHSWAALSPLGLTRNSLASPQ